MNDLRDTIGNTPLIKLSRIISNNNIELFAKLEGQNPGGSVKDRVALYMIEQAEGRGELRPGMTIIEASSGNMGISLAMTGSRKGYGVTIIMSEGMSVERRKMIKALGAELILTDRNFGTGGAIRVAKEMAGKNPAKYWLSDQFNNPDNAAAHYHGLAAEILRDIPDAAYLVAGIGTCGTLSGIAQRFRDENAGIRIVAAIPPAGYRIQGLQNPESDYRSSLYNEELIDEKILVSAEEAYAMARETAAKEGLFAGMSSGAALAAALQIAARIDKGKIVAILPDRGEKYLSTELFS